jgi:hypothetical protein
MTRVQGNEAAIHHGWATGKRLVVPHSQRQAVPDDIRPGK